MSYDFTFAGVALSSLHGVTTERPPREVAEYDFELFDIPGKSGSEYIDNKRYKNVPMTRKIGLIQRPVLSPDTIVEDLIEWLAYSQGYQEFEDSDHPGMVTYAVLTNFAEVQTILRRYHKATLKFSRVPFWYLKTALNPVSIDMSRDPAFINLKNPYKMFAQPMINIVVSEGAQANIIFELTHNDTTKRYSYPNVTGNAELVFDCEEQVLIVNYGSAKSFHNNEIPQQLDPGWTKFEIIDKSRISSATITPRWRCL